MPAAMAASLGLDAGPGSCPFGQSLDGKLERPARIGVPGLPILMISRGCSEASWSTDVSVDRVLQCRW